MNTTLTTEQKRAVLKAIADAVKPVCPKDHGVIVIVAPLGVPLGNGGEFASNLQRADAIKVLRDTASRLEKRLNERQ